MNRRWLPLLALLLATPAVARAQCPSGTPPPCRTVPPRAAPPRMSVAVLDFQNLSRDTADAYLGQGIAGELTTRLGQVSRLTVTSRAAVQRLRNSSDMALADVGHSLNASYLVNGSVQRSGQRLRVTAELVRASTGASVWTDAYDRSDTDLLAIQGAVATAVASAVTGRLLPDERTVLAAQPTRNPEAHAAYLRGKSLALGVFSSDQLGAVAAFERAVALDPDYLDAWSELAQADAYAYWTYADRSAARVERSRVAAERARALAPDAVATHTALANYYYWGRRDYSNAMLEVTAALAREPNNVTAVEAVANIARRLGDWPRAVESRLRELQLDPENAQVLDDLSLTYGMMRRFDESDAAAVRSAAIDTVMLASPYQAFGFLARDGSMQRVPRRDSVLAARPGQMITGLFKDPGFSLPFARMSGVIGRGLMRMAPPADSSDRAGYFILRGVAARSLGRPEPAAFDSAVAILARLVALRPDDEGYHAGFAAAHAGQGNCDAALREATRATELLPIERDALAGPQYIQLLAEIELQCGRVEQAIARLGPLLGRPSTLSVALLRSDPVWAPLRGNPRFDALIAPR